MLTDLLRDRHFEFPVERAVLLTVLYRLMGSGSERCAEKWKQDYSIAGVDALALQQLYGALAWLEERLPEPEQKGATPFVARTTKDVISKLNTAVIKALADPAVRAQLAAIGEEIFPPDQQTPEALGAFHKAEIEKWWPILKAANIRGE